MMTIGFAVEGSAYAGSAADAQGGLVERFSAVRTCSSCVRTCEICSSDKSSSETVPGGGALIFGRIKGVVRRLGNLGLLREDAKSVCTRSRALVEAGRKKKPTTCKSRPSDQRKGESAFAAIQASQGSEYVYAECSENRTRRQSVQRE